MRTVHLAALAGLVVLGACSKGPGGAPASGQVAAGPGSACAGYTAGSNGVIRTFCSGPGVATLSVGGVAHTLKGGECEQMGSMFSFNAGVVTGPGAKAPYPDYVGLTTQGTGAFSNAALPVHIDGKAYLVHPNDGTAGPKGGSFKGTGHPVGGGADVAISGTFTC